MSDEVVIRVDNVSKNFRLPHERAGSVKTLFTNPFSKNRKTVEVQHALKNVSFEVKKGEFFGIVGRNGSGKSTMLKMLAGIYQPTKGGIHVTGRLVPFIELGVGFNPELSGRENVYLNGALLGFSAQEIDRMYDEIVEFAELEKFMDQKLKNYSSGMQVRLAFSMAVRAKADVLLIDEVLAVGDADFQRKCFDYFQKLKGSETTVIFVTHDMDAVREYCDRAALIDKSSLVGIGPASEVAAEYTKLFIERPTTGEQKKTQKNEKRWGDGALEFIDIEAPSSLTDADSSLMFTCKVKAKQRTENVIIGFVVKNSAGNLLAGTNTLIEGTKIGEVHEGDVLSLSIKLENIFSDGEHSITLAALHKGGKSTADWWDDAIKIQCLREKITPYMIKPKIEIGVDNV